MGLQTECWSYLRPVHQSGSKETPFKEARRIQVWSVIEDTRESCYSQFCTLAGIAPVGLSCLVTRLLRKDCPQGHGFTHPNWPTVLSETCRCWNEVKLRVPSSRLTCWLHGGLRGVYESLVYLSRYYRCALVQELTCIYGQSLGGYIFLLYQKALWYCLVSHLYLFMPGMAAKDILEQVQLYRRVSNNAVLSANFTFHTDIDTVLGRDCSRSNMFTLLAFFHK